MVAVLKVPMDWRNHAGTQFQLLSELCQLANKTIVDSLGRFMIQPFITSNLISEYQFNRHLNITAEQFIHSMRIAFSQLLETVRLLIHVDQPFYHIGVSTEEHPLDLIPTVITNENNGQQSFKVCVYVQDKI